MNRFFVDSDVIIDLFMNRKPFVQNARHVIGMIETGKAEGCTSSLVIANVYYLLRKHTDKKKALEVLKKLTSILKVTPIEQNNIHDALYSPGKDFEDTMQHMAAVSGGCRYLVTRNIKDYTDNGICTPILPEHALSIMSL